MNPKFTSYLFAQWSVGRARGVSVKLPSSFRVIQGQKWLALLALALILAAPHPAAAQASTALPRVTARVDDTVLTVLHGNTHPLARAQYDQGAVADSLPIHRMLLLLQRSPDQEAALKTLMDQQQSKASPTFHQWLTPQQFGQQFGPADADVQTVTNWLSSHGFQVARVSNGGTVIEFSGTAGQVRNAFHTEIHRYVVNGEQHFANNSDPQIPTALTPVVAGPVSLHNFPKKPQSHTVGAFRKTKATGKVTPLYTIASGGFCGSTDCNAVSPGDFATIYNILPLWTATPAIDGSGQPIALIGDSDICTASSPDYSIPANQGGCGNVDDVAQFRSLFGLPMTNPTTHQSDLPTVIVDGPNPGLNGDETEGDLDVEWSGAVAKNATIDFVIAEGTEATFGTDLAAEFAVDNNIAPVISESFGQCEYYLGYDGNGFEATLWEQAAAQGITVIVSAGDGGSAGCDDPSQSAAFQFGPAVNGIASTPFNVAAGGTDFDISAANYQNTYWNLPANNSSVGGAAYDGLGDASAKSYIPETTWNDTCAQFITSASSSTPCAPNEGDIVGGGGGQSNGIPETEFPVLENGQEVLPCCYFYLKPSWQTLPESGAGFSGPGLTGNDPDFTRDLPDISLFAADGFISNSFYIICQADITGGPCNLATPYFDFVGVGGTSAGAPTFAGMMALVNQKMKILNANGTNPQYPTQQGNANYVLYHLYSSQTIAAANGDYSCNSSTGSNPACVFNDITKGNNSVPCYGGSFSCSNPSTSSGAYGVLEAGNLDTNNDALVGLPAFDAATGPDLASGLGSVNAYNLVNNWGSAVGGFTPTTTTLCLSKTQIPASETSCAGPLPAIIHGTPVYVNIAVNQNVNGTPSPIQVSENFSATPSLAEDVSLVGTFTSGNSCNLPGCNNTGGIDHFTSNALEPMTEFGPVYGVSNSDIYALTDGTFTSGGTSYLTGGQYNVYAHYSGDGNYGVSSSNPILVTVNPEGSAAYPCVMVSNPFSGALAGSVGITPGTIPPSSCQGVTTAYYGDVFLIRADVSGTFSGQENASGNVTMYDNQAPGIPTPTPNTVQSVFPLNAEGYLEDQTTFLLVGQHDFQAQYSGDQQSYSESMLSVGVGLNVIAAPTTSKFTAPINSPITITPGQMVTLAVSVGTAFVSNPSGGSLGNPPTGTVTFTNSTTGATLQVVGVTPTDDGSGYVAAAASYTFTPSATMTVTAVYTPGAVNGVNNVSTFNYLTSCAGASPCSNLGVTIDVGTAGINAGPSAACNNSTINIAVAGGSGTCAISVTGVNSFNGSVALTYAVTGTPANAVESPTCSFGIPGVNFAAPNTINLTPASESGSATMTCTTIALGARILPSTRPFGRGWPLATAAISLVCFFFLLAVPKRRWGFASLAVLLVVVTVAGVSCGGSSSAGGGGITNPGTTLGAYTIAVTSTPTPGGAAGAQMTPITVIVNSN